jgi:ABC-type multidrug transport system fused ATPase/permease subunit
MENLPPPIILTDTQKAEKAKFIDKYVNTISPIDSANCFQKMLFTWVKPIIAISQTVPFEEDMIYQVQESRSSQNEVPKFRENFDRILADKTPQILAAKYLDDTHKPNVLLRAVFKSYKWDIFVCLLFCMMYSIIEYGNTLLINLTLHAFSDIDASGEVHINYWRCSYCLLAILVLKPTQTVLNSNVNFFMDNLIGVRLVVVIRCFLFEKALRKPISRDKEFSIGEISNMNNSDIHKVTQVAWNSVNIVILPFEIIIGFCILAYLTGWAIVPTTGIIIFCAFVTRIFVIFSMRLQKRTQKQGDLLMKARWACYNNIRFIKMEAIENFFLDKIISAKLKKMWIDIKKKVLDNFLGTTNVIFNCGMLIAILGFYVYFGGELNVANLFTILGVFQRFKSKIYDSADLINSFTTAMVSIRRLNNFFISEEMETEAVIKIRSLEQVDADRQEGPVEDLEGRSVDGKDEYAIKIENGNFYWVDQRKAELVERLAKEQKL